MTVERTPEEELEAQFTSPEEEEDAPSEVVATAEEEADDLDEAVEPASSSPAPEDEIEVPVGDSTVRVPRDKLGPYVRFMTWAQNNPEGWEELVAWERGEKQLVPTATPPPQTEATDYADEDEEWIDPDEKVARLEARVAEMADILERRQRVDDRTTLDSAVTSFRDAHPDLSPEDLDRVYRRAADLQLVPRYLSSSPDRRSAITEAFEDAYRLEFYERAASDAGRQVTEQMRARRRAASATASSASTARVEAVPATRQERDAAIVRDIAEAMSANE